MALHLKKTIPFLALFTVGGFFLMAYTKGEEKHYERTYYEDGTLASEGWKRFNVKTDYWIFYHPNGKVSRQGYYAYGKKEKYWFYYDEHRVRTKEGRYANDLEEGWWLFYDRKGKIHHKCQRKQGVKNGYCLNYTDGKMTAAEQYKEGEKIMEWHNFEAFTKVNSLSDLK